MHDKGNLRFRLGFSSAHRLELTGNIHFAEPVSSVHVDPSVCRMNKRMSLHREKTVRSRDPRKGWPPVAVSYEISELNAPSRIP